MRRAAMWLFLIMIASYSIAYSAVRDMDIAWDEVNGLVVNDGVVLFSEGDRSDLMESENVNIDQVSRIEVKGISADIRVVPEKRADAFAELKGYYVAKSNYVPPKLVVTKYEDTLRIEVEHKKQMVSSNRVSLDLIVILPESYEGSLSIEGVSSDVNVEFGEFEELIIRTVSGDVRTESANANRIEVNTTSGEVELQEVSGKVDVDTTSGDVDVVFEEISGNANLRSTSGEVQMIVPSAGDFAVDFSTTSGEIQSSVELEVDKMSERKLTGKRGKYEYTLDASTISGDIILR